MSAYRLQLSDQSEKTIGSFAPVLTVGRSPENDWVLADASLSRHHARFEWSPQGLAVRDLGSRFGTALNGAAVKDPMPVRPGDELILGNVQVQVVELAEPSVHIDPEAAPDLGLTAFAVPAATLRGAGVGRDGGRSAQALTFVHDLALGLVREVSTQELLEDLLDKLLVYLEADRGAVLLKDSEGRLAPKAIRVRGARGSGRQITLSRTLVEAALDRREALLLTDPQGDPELASRSLVLSGVTTAIVAPLEAEGEVTGLIYFDAHSILKQFTREDLQLATTLAHIAAAKIHGARLMVEAQKTRALEQEMAIAREIQMRMLPLGGQGDLPYDLHAELRAAREVGGDLYDYHWRNGRLWFCIGDVSGKGVPAALVMALTKTLFRANGAFLQDPAQMMVAVNGLLYEETGPAIFVSAFCGLFDPADGRLVFCNAGHEAPVILSPSQPVRFLDIRRGLALGILPEFAYQAEEIVLSDREAILLYTDGVTEALNPVLELFTADRFQSVLERRAGEEPQAVVRHVLAALDQFAAGAPQADDITLLCLRHRGAAPELPSEG